MADVASAANVREPEGDWRQWLENLAAGWNGLEGENTKRARQIIQYVDQLERRTVMRLGYAVIEQSESLGLTSLDHEVFLNYDEARERRDWLAVHLTGSYADAGDTECSVVGFELSKAQHAIVLSEYEPEPVA